MNNDEVNRLNDEVRALMYAERIAVLEPIGDSEEGLAATIAEWQSVLAEVNRERVMLIARCERAERERDIARAGCVELRDVYNAAERDLMRVERDARKLRRLHEAVREYLGVGCHALDPRDDADFAAKLAALKAAL